MTKSYMLRVMRGSSAFRWAVIVIALSGLAFGQAPARSRVLGAITEASASSATVKTDSGELFSVVFQPETKFQKVAPGEKDLTKAETIAATDLAVGDRVLARGIVGANAKTLNAVSVILMSARDIAQKNEKEKEEWTRNGVGGLILSTDPAAKEIKIRIPSMRGPAHEMTIVLKDDAILRRYAPDSVRFADAKSSTFAELEAGDQVRARGEKSADGARLTAVELVSGRFRTVAGSVTTLNTAAGELEMKELGTGKILSIKITPDSNLRRLPQMQPAAQAVAGAPPVGGVPGAHRNGADIQQMLEHMPSTSLGEIKPGETIVVASTVGAIPDRLTAVTLLAGADALVAMSQQAAGGRGRAQGGQGGQTMGSWNLGDMPIPTM